MGDYKILMQFDIAADPETVHHAIETEEGIRAWWSKQTTGPAEGQLRVRFPDVPQPFEFAVGEGDGRIEWATGGFPPWWAGTTIRFDRHDSDPRRHCVAPGLHHGLSRRGLEQTMPASNVAGRLATAAAPSPPRILPRDGGANRVTGAARQTHVMVVEDDRDTREVVKLILELDGIGVTEASDGLEALAQLHHLRANDPRLPCAILLDIMMPRCSGPEFRKRQLDDPLIADVPIIVLSAVADQARLDDLHAFAKVSKPFDPDQLVRVVREACHSIGD